MNVPDTPFTILAMGPFTPLNPSARTVAVATVDEAVAAFSPEMWVPLARERCPEGGVHLKPSRMKDFTPDGMVESVPWLKSLSDAASLVTEASGRGVPPEEIAGLVRERLPGVPLDLSYTPSAGPRKEARSAVDDILSMVASPGAIEGKETAKKGTGPAAWKGQIEAILSGIMEEIFANEDFRVFEAAWRGLEAIAKRGPAGPGRETRLIAVSVARESLPSILDTLEESLAEDPPNLVLIDLPFDNSQVHIEVMERLADFAETLLAPAAVWLTPGFFNISGWEGLRGLSYLKTYVEDAAYAKWRNLCATPEGRWLVAVCNRFLARFPYGEELRARTVSFTEASPPWVSPVFALGALAARSASLFGTPYRLTDSEQVGLEDCGLADLGDGVRASTEVLIPLDRARQMAEIGVSALLGVHMKDTVHIPLARAVSGEPLALQMFFSCVTGFLIRLKNTVGPSAGGDDGTARVKDALELFFSRAGCRPPEDLEVEADEVTETGAVPLNISFTPPREMLPGAGRIFFRFMW